MPKKPKVADKPRSKNVIGVIRITGKPIGFVVPNKSDQGAAKAEEDLIIFEENLNCALDKDEVEAEVIGRDRDRKKGRVVRIIKRNKTQFVGTLEKSGQSWIFKPDDWKFYRNIEIHDFPKEKNIGMEQGELKALVELSDWTNPNLNPKGKIITIIGKKGEHETEMQSILLDRGIVYDFPPEVEEEAKRAAEEFRKTTSPLASRSPLLVKEREGAELGSGGVPSPDQGEVREHLGEVSRRDFRGITTFTIDPKDAKDFDDALSYEELEESKIRVGVHIADVSHFVRPGTALDREARERSFSTYLVDRTIPMLPEVLSNDLCSLNPNVDRFAFSAVFDIEKKTGKVLDRWFGKTIINSDKRFSYEEAQEVLNTSPLASRSPLLVQEREGAELVSGDVPSSSRLSVPSPDQGEGARRAGGVFEVPLSELNRLANIYRAENKKNGAIEFETDEVKFELDENGKPLRIYKKPRLDTMKMIEEWMLLANREVAKFISDKLIKRGGASIFRIHNLPKMEKIEELAIFVKALGYELPLKNGEVSAKDINILLQKIEGHASESLIKTATIRSMAKAVYSTKNIGHFGLAFEYYTHFTSPIRRYPDLMIHRILENHLKGGKISKDEIAKFEKISIQASDKEITVQEAERESIKYKQVEFMMDKIGQEFDAVISGVTEWGMYVENPETKVEGMVRLKDIVGDRFELDQKNYAIIGQTSKKKYSLGDSVRVRLASADLDRKTLDFKLV